MTNSKNSFKAIAILAARAGDSKKASPVAVFDLPGTSPLADYAVLMGVESAPQLDAVEEEVVVRLKHEGVYCRNKDGMRSKTWKVLDYGGTLVHIYDGKAAEFYALDKIYGDCKLVAWEEKPAPAPAPQKAAPKAAPAPKKAAVKPAPKKAAKKAVKKTAAKKAPAKKIVKKAVSKKAAPKKKPARKAAKKK